MRLYFQYHPNENIILSKNGDWSYQVYETPVFYDEQFTQQAGIRVETKLIKSPNEAIAIRQNIFYLKDGTICCSSSELNSPSMKIFEYPIIYGTNKYLGLKGVAYASNIGNSSKNIVIDIQFETEYYKWYILFILLLFAIYYIINRKPVYRKK